MDLVFSTIQNYRTRIASAFLIMKTILAYYRDEGLYTNRDCDANQEIEAKIYAKAVEGIGWTMDGDCCAVSRQR